MIHQKNRGLDKIPVQISQWAFPRVILFELEQSKSIQFGEPTEDASSWTSTPQQKGRHFKKLFEISTKVFESINYLKNLT